VEELTNMVITSELW